VPTSGSHTSAIIASWTYSITFFETNTRTLEPDFLVRLAEMRPGLEEVTCVFEVTLDREVGEVRVFDVLDGNAEPTVVTLAELRSRLG
jgi:hypothetical protein